MTLTILILPFLVLAVIGKCYNQTNWGHPVVNIIDGLVRVYCRNFHRQSSEQIDIPDNHKLIIASNHISGLDPLILISATSRPIRFMIAKEEYENPLLNWLYRGAQCIPVDRRGRVEAAFRETIKAINNNELIGIFPQGGIHCAEEPRKTIKPGIIKLSQLTECEVLPIRISGVGAPGSNLLKAFFFPSQVKLETRALISSQAFQTKGFSQELADWFINDTKDKA